MNLTRKQVFRIFREAIFLAENHVDSGGDVLLPEHLFTLNTQELDDVLGDRNSISSEENYDQPENLLIIGKETDVEVYKFPKKLINWDDDECLSSSVETLSDVGAAAEEEKSDPNISPSIAESEEDFPFYKPNMDTPPRFKSSDNEFEATESSITLDNEPANLNESSTDDENGVWTTVSRKEPRGPCPSRILDFDAETEDHHKTQKQLEVAAQQAWYDYHLWQIRKDHFQEENQKFRIYSQASVFSDDTDGTKNFQQQFIQFYSQISKEEKNKTNEKLFINTCVIMAIKEFVYDYFSESFQFSLIKMAYRTPHYIITQDLLKEWQIPKIFKGDFKRPHMKNHSPEKKAKKEKKIDQEEKVTKGDDKKEKKDQKGKKVKKDKSEKKKEKEDNDINKVAKKEKKKKGKEDSKASSTKKKTALSKKSPPLKEETLMQTAMSSRMQIEMVKREAEEKRQQENKKYIFPLAKSVDRQFFKRIFPDLDVDENQFENFTQSVVSLSKVEPNKNTKKEKRKKSPKSSKK